MPEKSWACVGALYASTVFYGDTKPASYQFEISDWRINDGGLHQSHAKGTAALRGDGSRMLRTTGESFRNVFERLRSENCHFVSFYPSRELAEISHELRTVHLSHCQRTSWKPFADEGPDCRSTAEYFLPSCTRLRVDGIVAGHAVVRYQQDDDGDYQSAISLAPGLGCHVMELTDTVYGRFGIPVRRRVQRIMAYRPGEPDPALFALPAGYAIRREN